MFKRIIKISSYILPLLVLISCSTHQDIIKWNVELKEGDISVKDKCSPDTKLQSIKSTEKPELIPASEDQDAVLRITGMPCITEGEHPLYVVPISRIKRITYLSDPLTPPEEVPLSDLNTFKSCCRFRNGFWIFDKFEIRGLIGYRGIDEEIGYLQPDGSTLIYKSKFVGFDRGGSTLIFGIETSGMWDLALLDKTKHLQGGFILGYIPTDESNFFPVGLNIRYTFKQQPVSKFDNCNTWYLFGNAGLPIDFETKAPTFYENSDFQRYFYGFGIGYDWALNCKLDFSIDLGYKEMNLPLPACEVCELTPIRERYPFRNSKLIVLRFGLTY